MKNRKARITTVWMLVLLILAIVALAIGIYMLHKISKGQAADVEDDLCKKSNMWRSMVTIPVIGEARPGVLIPKATKFCMTQYETIDASDFTRCDPEFGEEFKHGSILEALRGCAAHQIAQLAWRCWWMGGEGNWGEVGSWKCFTAKITMDQYEGDESYTKVEANLRRQLKDKLDCYSEQERLIKGSAGDCEVLAGKIADKLIRKLAYNGLIDFYKDRDEEAYADKIEAAQNEIKKLNKDIGGDIESSLKEEFKGEDITVEVCREYKADCEAEIGEDYEEKCCAKYEEQTILENTFEAALTIGGTLPNIGSIKEADIIKIIKTKNNTVEMRRYEPYRPGFPSDKFKLTDKFEINPNSLFEIGFCDPPIEIGDGPLARMQCNVFAGQQIQLGPGGTIGVSREGSPYCNVFNAFNNLPIIKEMQKYCEVKTKQL